MPQDQGKLQAQWAVAAGFAGSMEAKESALLAALGVTDPPHHRT